MLGICGKALRTFGDNRIGDSGWILKMAKNSVLSMRKNLQLIKKITRRCTLAAPGPHGGRIVKRKVDIIGTAVPIQFSQLQSCGHRMGTSGDLGSAIVQRLASAFSHRSAVKTSRISSGM